MFTLIDEGKRPFSRTTFNLRKRAIEGKSDTIHKSELFINGKMVNDYLGCFPLLITMVITLRSDKYSS